MASPSSDSINSSIAEHEMKDTNKEKRKSSDLINKNSVISSLQTTRLFKSILVIAEGWPSWVYSVGGLFQDTPISVIVKSPLIKSFHHHWFDKRICWIDWNRWTDAYAVRCLSQPILFCIQGSVSFVNDSFGNILAFSSVTEMSCILALDLMITRDVPGSPLFMHLDNDKFTMPNISTKGFKSRTVKHSDCGGVTKDKRRVLAIKSGRDLINSENLSTTFIFKNFGSSIRRSLGYFIDTTQGGRSKPPKKISSHIFNTDEIIPISSLSSCWIKAPSIYSKSEIYRHLTLNEILALKDLPADMAKHLKEAKCLAIYFSISYKQLLQRCYGNAQNITL